MGKTKSKNKQQKRKQRLGNRPAARKTKQGKRETEAQSPTDDAKSAGATKPPPAAPKYPPGQGFRALTERWTAERVECVVELLHNKDQEGLKRYLASSVPQHPHAADPVDKVELKGFHFNALDYRVDLGRVHFKNLNLWSCRFEDVNLKDAIFEDCALGLSTFIQAYLRGVKFIRCDLLGCHFEHSILDYAAFEQSKLRFVTWAETQVDIEALPKQLEEEKEGRFDAARDIYKALRLNLHALGDEAGASWATYKQCIMDRKHLWKQKQYAGWFGSLIMDVMWGYGEKPSRLFFFSLLFCSLCAVGYFVTGVAVNGKCTSVWSETQVMGTFFRCLYFSFVTFTTLGYGDLAPCTPLSRFLVSFEAFSGVFIMGLFVTANVRKLSGR